MCLPRMLAHKVSAAGVRRLRNVRPFEAEFEEVSNLKGADPIFMRLQHLVPFLALLDARLYRLLF